MAFTIYDVADLLRANLKVERRNNVPTKPWMADFEGWHIRENESIVSGACGYGDTPNDAINAFCGLIRDKNIETVRMENRLYYKVPKSMLGVQ